MKAPATALPAALLQDAERFRGMSGPEFADLPIEEKRRLSAADELLEAAEEAERDRRALAYPELVAALKEATESLDDLMRAPKIKHFRQQEATRFYALLRKLGEG